MGQMLFEDQDKFCWRIRSWKPWQKTTERWNDSSINQTIALFFLLFFPHLIFHTQSLYRENTSCINKEWEKAGETLARQMNAMEVFDQFKRKRNETHKAKKQHEKLLFGRISDPDSSVANNFSTLLQTFLIDLIAYFLFAWTNCFVLGRQIGSNRWNKTKNFDECYKWMWPKHTFIINSFDEL